MGVRIVALDPGMVARLYVYMFAASSFGGDLGDFFDFDSDTGVITVSGYGAGKLDHEFFKLQLSLVVGVADGKDEGFRIPGGAGVLR